MSSSLLAIIPGVIALLVTAVLLGRTERQPWVLGGAIAGILAAVASPWLSIWYAQAILGDRTANIGAGMLMMFQPILVPVGAGLGAILGSVAGTVFEARFRR